MTLPRIAVDAMGGDEGVRVMVSGAALARRRHDKFKFLLVGDEVQIKAALENHPNMRNASEILHCDGVVEGHEKPTQALRRAKSTSMGLAIEAVKSGDAGAAVSAGNTGALMAMSKLALRTLPGIDRPALAGLMPTLEEHDVVMLDLGANTECDARNLVQFAIMGAAYSRIVTGADKPRVRLLNIGTEEIKGSARFVTDLLKNAFRSSLRSKIGFLVSRPATELLRHHLDPNNHNGAVFLGLNGVVVKSHGSASVAGVANAVAVAARLLEESLTERIAAGLAELGEGRLRENGVVGAAS